MYRRVKAARNDDSVRVDLLDVHSFSPTVPNSGTYTAVVADVLTCQDFNYGDEVLLRDNHADGIPWVCAVLKRSGGVTLEARFQVAEQQAGGLLLGGLAASENDAVYVASRETRHVFEERGAVVRGGELNRIFVHCPPSMTQALAAALLRGASYRWQTLLGDATTVVCEAAIMNTPADDVGRAPSVASLDLPQPTVTQSVEAFSLGWWETWLREFQDAGGVTKKLNTAKYLERVLDSLCSDPVAVYATRTGNGQLVARDAVTALMPAETT